MSAVAEKWHGTSGGYTNHKCRCAGCRVAWAACIKDLDRRKSAKRESCTHPKWIVRSLAHKREICSVCRKTRNAQ